MDMRGFDYENTAEDMECPFCGNLVPKGSSVCGKCRAVHGSNMSSFGAFISLVLFILSIVWGFSAGAGTGSIIVGVLVFLLFLCLVGLAANKLFTKTGWFR